MSEHAPDLRFLQANERTLLAWVRTGLALMAFGFVLARLAVWLHLEHPDQDAGLASTILGIAAIAVGVACHGIGAVRFVRARRALVAGMAIAPGAVGPVLVAGIVGAVGVGIIVFVATTSR